MAGQQLILSIETSTGCGSISVTRGGLDQGTILAEATAQPETTHSRRLLGSVDWVMSAAGISWGQLDGVAISLGPGSFTGLRIGMAAAKGIAFAAELPLLGVPTLEALVLACPLSCSGCVWSLLDARKQEVFAACFQPIAPGRYQQVGDILAIRPEKLLERLEGPAVMVGPGVDTYRDTFSVQDNLILVPASFSAVRAARIGFLAAEQLASGKILDPVSAAPLYVRASEAEINFLKKQNSDQANVGETP